MPAIKSLPDSITSLSDQELADCLRGYNVAIGPILPSTRRVYQMKLFKLQTGQEAPPSNNYEPVDDEDEDEEDQGEGADDDSPDEEVILQHQQPRQRTTQRSRSETSRTPSHRTVAASSVSSTKSTHRPESLQCDTERVAAAPETSRGGLSFWVKLLAVVAIALFVFFVIKTMESNPDSEIPEQIEVNV